jgi:AraC-like DNA-binding protein
VPHRCERILPSGCVQVIVNLARDSIREYNGAGRAGILPPALVVGARSVYEIVDTSDMAELMGVVFRPAGFVNFAGDAVDLFTNRNIALEDLWGRSVSSVRSRLQEIQTPQAKLFALEEFLGERFAEPCSNVAIIDFALDQFARSPSAGSVAQVAATTGWSVRYFSQFFRERVGLPPKVWCRIQRFQRAVQHLHAGVDIRWAELALDCGYYDQSHFANDFRAFSGIDARTYSARRTRWANHIPLD